MSKCCICIPLEIGVKLIAAMTILGTIGTGYSCYTDPAYGKVFYPIFWSALAMSIIWTFTLISDSRGTRKLAFWGSLTLRVLLHAVWYGYCILQGTAQAYACNEERLA